MRIRYCFTAACAALFTLAGCGQGASPAATTAAVPDTVAPANTAALRGNHASAVTDAPAAATTPANAARAGASAPNALASTMAPLALQPGQKALLALAGGSRGGNMQFSANGIASVPTNTYHEAAAPDAEMALRAYDARFADVKAHNGYRLQATRATKVGDVERLWVMAISENGQSDRSVQARVAYAGAHCRVLVDQKSGNALNARAEELGRAFDEKIYPTDSRIFGEPLAAGRDPKVTLLISPEVDDNGKGRVLGYFTLRDLFSPSDAPGVPELQKSNQRMILYMSANVVQKGKQADYLGTLAHEFQHLICGTYKTFGKSGGRDQEEVWLNEGLSMYAMQANGYGLDSDAGVLFNHVSGYLADPGKYSLTDWDRNPNRNGYGAVYLFVNYLVERAGEGVLRELESSSEVGIANINARLAAKGLSFDQLFRDWVAANLFDGQAGAPGYAKIDINGSYPGGKLNGAALEQLDLPTTSQIALLPHSARYLQLGSNKGGTFDLGFSGNLGDGTGGWLARP